MGCRNFAVIAIAVFFVVSLSISAVAFAQDTTTTYQTPTTQGTTTTTPQTTTTVAGQTTTTYSTTSTTAAGGTCGSGPISASCSCGGATYASGYCCANVYQTTACGTGQSATTTTYQTGGNCYEGPISGSCSCGGTTYTTGYCCSGRYQTTYCTATGGGGSECNVPNGKGTMQNGVCVTGYCNGGFYNCDARHDNGCESNSICGGGQPGTTKKYDGQSCSLNDECHSNFCSGGVCAGAGTPGYPGATSTTGGYTQCSRDQPWNCNDDGKCRNIGLNWCVKGSGEGFCQTNQCALCSRDKPWDCYNDVDCKNAGANWCQSGGKGFCQGGPCPEFREKPKAFCGNAICEYPDENEVSCPQDCRGGFKGGREGIIKCGDGICGEGEGPFNCHDDCQEYAVCGNNRCESGEERSCQSDCFTERPDKIKPPPGFFCPAAVGLDKPTYDPAARTWCCGDVGGARPGSCSAPLPPQEINRISSCIKKAQVEFYYTSNDESRKQIDILGPGFEIMRNLGFAVNCNVDEASCAAKQITTCCYGSTAPNTGTGNPTWFINGQRYEKIFGTDELERLTGCKSPRTDDFTKGRGGGFGPPTIGGGFGEPELPPELLLSDPVQFMAEEALRHIKLEMPPDAVDFVCAHPEDFKEKVKTRALFEFSQGPGIENMCDELRGGAERCSTELSRGCSEITKAASEACAGRYPSFPGSSPTGQQIGGPGGFGPPQGGGFGPGDFGGKDGFPPAGGFPGGGPGDFGPPAGYPGGGGYDRGGFAPPSGGGYGGGGFGYGGPGGGYGGPTPAQLCEHLTKQKGFVCDQLPKFCVKVKEKAVNCDPDKFKPELIAEKVSERVVQDLCNLKAYKPKIRDAKSVGDNLPVVIASSSKLKSDQLSKIRALTTKFDDAPLKVATTYIYRATAKAANLANLRRLDFVDDVTVDHMGLAGPDEGAPVRGNEKERYLQRLEALKELDKIPDSLDAHVTENERDIIQATDDIEEVQNKSKDIGYALQQFFGMVAEQEKKDAALLKERAQKLRDIGSSLNLVLDASSNLDAKAALQTQIQELNVQADLLDKQADDKDRFAGGFLAMLFGGAPAATTTTTSPTATTGGFEPSPE